MVSGRSCISKVHVRIHPPIPIYCYGRPIKMKKKSTATDNFALSRHFTLATSHPICRRSLADHLAASADPSMVRFSFLFLAFFLPMFLCSQYYLCLRDSNKMSTLNLFVSVFLCSQLFNKRWKKVESGEPYSSTSSETMGSTWSLRQTSEVGGVILRAKKLWTNKVENTKSRNGGIDRHNEGVRKQESIG